MKCLINTFENEEGKTNVVSLVIRSIVLSIPNLVDIVLTILSFDKDNKIYFILRFIAQFLNIIFCISCGTFCSYKSEDGIDGLGYFIFFASSACCYFGMEIPSLIFFIKDYYKIKFLGILGYYIHLAIVPLFCFNCSINTMIESYYKTHH